MAKVVSIERTRIADYGGIFFIVILWILEKNRQILGQVIVYFEFKKIIKVNNYYLSRDLTINTGQLLQSYIWLTYQINSLNAKVAII